MTDETVAVAPHDNAGASSARIDLSSVELLALVSMRSNAATDRARAMLGLPEDGLDSPLTSAGVSSLLVRQLATVRQGRLAPQGPTNAIAWTLMNAEEWTEAIGTTGDVTNVAAVVRSADGTVLFEPRPYKVWNVWPMPQDDPLPRIGARFVEATFGNLPADRPFTGSVRVINDDSTTRSAVVTVAEDESWTLASGPGGEISTPVPTSPDPTFRALASSLA